MARISRSVISAYQKVTSLSAIDAIARLLSRVGLATLSWAVPRLDPAERLSALKTLQSVALGFRENDPEVLRRYARGTIDRCAVQLPSRQKVELVTDVTRKALSHVERDHLSEASASIIEMARVQPRMVDPASFTARSDDDRLLVVGPWLMEVGFEILYWIPYLRAALQKLAIPKERVVAVSRGGAQLWYNGVAGQYLDILDVLSPQEFRDWTSEIEFGKNDKRSVRKQFAAQDFELSILRRVLKSADITDYQVILPSAMYALMRNVWRARFGGKRLENVLSHALIDRPEPINLPFKGPYIAAKFYHSTTFPDTPTLHQFAREIVARLASRSNVVLLSNAVQLDDHDTFAFEPAGGKFQIFEAAGLYTPRNNLSVQTSLVAHAKELHVTYGGFSYLGPLLGVETTAYTGTCNFTITHLDLAWNAFDRIGAAPLNVVPLPRKIPESRRPSDAATESLNPKLRDRSSEIVGPSSR